MAKQERSGHVYETIKGWFRGGFWRTNHGYYDKLFLVFLCILMTLFGLGTGAPLHDELRHHRHDPESVHNLGDIIIPEITKENLLARHRRSNHQVNATRHHQPNQRNLRRRNRNKSQRHTINPRNTQQTMCYDDVGSKTYLTETVFDGKARSRSAVKNGVYNVTFVVQSVFKGGEVGFTRSPVRLQFAEKKEGDPECPNSGLVKANIKRGGKYIVFVDKVGPHSFVARGEPAMRSKINVQAVKDVLCPNCVRKPMLAGLDDVTTKVNEKLRLVCRTRGNPLPLLHWYKDGVRVHKNKSVKIRSKMRRTTLVVTRLTIQDAGKYECRAISATGATDRISARVSVHADTRHDNATIAWRVPRPCPIEHYCMNEGTCTYYDTVGELSCSCAEGYKGTRCEEKDVYNRANGSMYRPMTYFCKLGMTASYYC